MKNDIQQSYYVQYLKKIILNKCNIESLIDKLGINIEKRSSEPWNILIKTIYRDEQNPSMWISSVYNAFHCFSTNKSGNVITFYKDYMKQQNIDLSYEDACKQLLQLFNIDYNAMELSYDDIPFIDKQRIECFNELIKIATYYIFTEPGKKAIEYLNKRNINLETIKIFSLGYLDQKASKYLIKSKYYNLYKKYNIIDDNDNFYYNNYIIIPVFDKNNNPVSFTGRCIDDNNKVKYLNLPTYEGFQENQDLYNLNIAESSETIQEQSLYIVEGCFDVWRLFQLGIKNVVALKTSHISDKQIALIRETHFKEIILLLDADDPGKEAILKIAQSLKNAFYPDDYFNISIINDEDYLSSKLDPDSFFNQDNLTRTLSHKYDYLKNLLEEYFMKYKNNLIDVDTYLDEVGDLFTKYPSYLEKTKQIIQEDENKALDMKNIELYIQDDYAKCLYLINTFHIEHAYANKIISEIQSFQEKFQKYISYLRKIYMTVKEYYNPKTYKIQIYEKSKKKKIYGNPVIFIKVKHENREIFKIEINYKDDILLMLKRHNITSERNEKEFFNPKHINLRSTNEKKMLNEIKKYLKEGEKYEK